MKLIDRGDRSIHGDELIDQFWLDGRIEHLACVVRGAKWPRVESRGCYINVFEGEGQAWQALR